MSGSLFQIACSGIAASRASIELTAQNIANAANPDYARRSLGVSEMVGVATGSNGVLGGVRIEGIVRNDSAIIQQQARSSASELARADAELTALRETYLFKELELATSMAYGPGTGDPVYEEQGQDYPYAYVRWTEGRNMAAFLEQLAAGAVRTEPLVTHEFGIDDAPRAFDVVTGRTGERANSDPFNPWGALLGLVGLMDAGAVPRTP